MFESDGKLCQKLFKTSRILREKSLIFQYHRDYPQGLPSFYHDYSFREDIQTSSDSDINTPCANPFYQDLLLPGITKQNKSRKQQFIINKLIDSHGFEYEKVQSVIRKHPHASYEKILEILTNVQRPKNDIDNDEKEQDMTEQEINDMLDIIPSNQPQRSEESEDFEDVAYDTGDIGKKYTLSSTASSQLPKKSSVVDSPEKEPHNKPSLDITVSDQDNETRKLSLTIDENYGNVSDNSPTSKSPTSKSPKRGKTPPPPPKTTKKSPKPPPKPTELLKQIKRESKKRLLETQNEFAKTIHFPSQNDDDNNDENKSNDKQDNDANNDNELERKLPDPLHEGNEGDNEQESEEESLNLSDLDNEDEDDDEKQLNELEKVLTPKLQKSDTAIQFQRNVSVKNRKSATNVTTTSGRPTRTRRVHSKSVSSPNIADLDKKKHKSLYIKKTPPPPPSRPKIPSSLSSNQVTPHKHSETNSGLLPELNLSADTQSLSGNESENDQQKSKRDRSYHWRRSATVDLTNKKFQKDSNRSSKFKRKRNKNPPPSHSAKSPPPPSRDSRPKKNKHERKRSSTIITSIIENERVGTASDKSTSVELLSSATELIDEDNLLNDTQHNNKNIHKKSLTTANLDDVDMNDVKTASESDDDFFMDGLNDGLGLVPTPMFHRQSFNGPLPSIGHSKSVSHAVSSPPSAVTAEHARILNKNARAVSVHSGRKKKRPIPKNHIQIAQLMKKDNRLS